MDIRQGIMSAVNENESKEYKQMECECKGLNVVLRPIRRADLAEIHRIMQLVPWSTKREDIEDGFRVRPDAMFGAFLAHQPHTIVSHVMVTAWGNHHGYLGWYVTDPAYRGRGVGSRLFDWARQCVGDVALFLDADPGMDKVYARVGFSTVRHTQCISGKAKIPEQAPKIPPNVTIEDLSEDSIPLNFHYIEEYDKQFYAIDRSALLKSSLVHPPVRYTKIAIRNRKCVGYACMRSTDGECHTVCPLVADDETIAEILLCELITEHKMQGQWLDFFVPKENMEETMKVIAKYGVDSPRDVETVMCTKPEEGKAICEKIPWNKIYGLLFNNFTII